MDEVAARTLLALPVVRVCPYCQAHSVPEDLREPADCVCADHVGFGWFCAPHYPAHVLLNADHHGVSVAPCERCPERATVSNWRAVVVRGRLTYIANGELLCEQHYENQAVGVD